MTCLQKDYAICRVEMVLARGKMEARGAATTPVQIPWESSYGHLQEGSGGGGRDVDGTEGCAGAVFTGLGDRWGREGARIMPSFASSSGDQVGDNDRNTGGGAYWGGVEPCHILQRSPTPQAHHRLVCPTAYSPWFLLQEVQGPRRTRN